MEMLPFSKYFQKIHQIQKPGSRIPGFVDKKSYFSHGQIHPGLVKSLPPPPPPPPPQPPPPPPPPKKKNTPTPTPNLGTKQVVSLCSP